MPRLFVYGTLLPEFETHRLIEPYLTASPVPGRVKGRLIDVGAYPALVPSQWLDREAGDGWRQTRADSDESVRGIWVEVTREGLAVADRYEEFYGIEETNDYERIWIADADNPGRSGWIYVWDHSRGFPHAGVDSWLERTERA